MTDDERCGYDGIGGRCRHPWRFTVQGAPNARSCQMHLWRVVEEMAARHGFSTVRVEPRPRSDVEAPPPEGGGDV